LSLSLSLSTCYRGDPTAIEFDSQPKEWGKSKQLQKEKQRKQTRENLLREAKRNGPIQRVAAKRPQRDGRGGYGEASLPPSPSSSFPAPLWTRVSTVGSRFPVALCTLCPSFPPVVGNGPR
jgi:hypothetical protein